MAEVPRLNQLCVSDGNPFTGTITDGSIAVTWLQLGINMFYSVFPWASIVDTADVSYVASTNTIALPADFILDFRNGLLLTVGTRTKRLRRRGLQDVLNVSLRTQEGPPQVYGIQGANLLVAPTPDQAYTGTLWYYARPAALTTSVVPQFPSDLVLVEFIRIKAMEFIRAAPPGAAIAYCEQQIVKLRKSGLGHEPESEDIPLDPYTFIPNAGGAGAPGWAWMGNVGE